MPVTCQYLHVCSHIHTHTYVGGGTMLAAISHVVQREPDYVVGKPSMAMLDVLKEM